MCNKTACFYRHIVRPLNLLKIPFKKMKAFFIQIFSSSNLVFFPNLIFLWFVQTTLDSSGKKTLFWYNIIWCAFYRKFALFNDFEKVNFFSKKPSIFSKNPNFVRFAKSYNFSLILRQTCYNLERKKLHVQKVFDLNSLILSIGN